jgi:excisionase family DNA binding protein
MNRKEVADALGCSEKTVSRYIGSGKLPVISRERGGAVNVSPEAVEDLRDRLEAERLALGTGQGDTGLAVAPRGTITPKGPTAQETLAMMVAVATEAATEAVLKASHEASGRPSEVSFKTVLTIDEAHTLTGFSSGRLKAAIKAGDLKAGKVGRGWVIRRADLDAWTEGLF